MSGSDAEILQRASSSQGAPLEALLYHHAPDVLSALLDNPNLNEQHLLILLSRRDLPREIVARIGHNKEWMKSYRLKVALVRHPATPRPLALPLLKFIYVFDLMVIAAAPGVSPELRRLAEQMILSQRESLALGQRLTLARQGPHHIAAALLTDSDRRVIEAALSNPAMSEEAVTAALFLERSSSELTVAVAAHPRWSLRHAVKLALARNPHLSLARFAGIVAQLPLRDLMDLARDHRVPHAFRQYALRFAQSRKATQPGNQV